MSHLFRILMLGTRLAAMNERAERRAQAAILKIERDRVRDEQRKIDQAAREKISKANRTQRAAEAARAATLMTGLTRAVKELQGNVKATQASNSRDDKGPATAGPSTRETKDPSRRRKVPRKPKVGDLAP